MGEGKSLTTNVLLKECGDFDNSSLLFPGSCEQLYPTMLNYPTIGFFILAYTPNSTGSANNRCKAVLSQNKPLIKLIVAHILS